MKRSRFVHGLAFGLGISLLASAQGKGSKPGAKAGEDKAAGKAPGKGKPGKSELSGKITVTVVDVAGGRAYVEPGADAGLRAGDSAEIEGKKYTVVAASPSNAVLELGKLSLKLGAKGLVIIDPYRQPPKIEPLPAPAPLASFRSSWAKPVLPAASQKPRPIPLGPIVRAERSRVLVGLSSYGVVPTSGDEPTWARAEARASLHYEPFVELPFAFDADLQAGAWLGGSFEDRAGSSSRPLVRVRELAAQYGSDAAFLAALGRLRYASSTLGSLDGIKLRAPLFGGLSLAAFGGFVQNPLSGAPSADASRFGGELEWQDDDAAWRPRAVVGGHASRFDGKLDERRLDFLFDLNPEFGRFGTYAEVDFFDRQNPWNASTTELSAAGADVAVRFGAVDLGARFAMQRPERSRYLASFLPPEWLCIRRATGNVPEPCIGNDAVYVAGGDVGVGVENLRLSGGANYSRTENTDMEQFAGYGNLRLMKVAGELRIDTGVSGSRGTLLQTAALLVSPGISFLDDRGDVSLRYRPALIRYEASTKSVLEHSAGGALFVSPGANLDVSLDADFVTGGDFDALILQSALIWRAGF